MSVVMEPEARFRVLFESTYPTLRRYARNRGLSGQDAEDLLAATYEVAWRRFDRVPAGQESIPWLLTVAVNHLRNRQRKLSRERKLVERLAAPDLAPPGPEAGVVDWRELRRALDSLSRLDRELVLLVAWDELTPAAAAAVLGLTPGAARTRLHRTRARLATLLNEAEQTHDAQVVPGTTSTRRQGQ